MNITTYFLKHPVIALILNIMIALVGLLSFNELSIREYPEVHFPKINVQVRYPNASAEVVEEAITNPLEDKLAGVEGLESITSDSKYSISEITLTFKNGVSIDKSVIAIREAIGLVDLPKEAKPPLIERKKASDTMPFMIIAIESSSMNFAELTHYTNLNLKNALRSVQGVSSVEIWGQPYTYNIILDARKMYAFKVNVDEIMAVLRLANLSLSAGRFQDEVSVTLNSEMKSVEDYENLVVKEKGDHPPVLLKHVAQIMLKEDDRQVRVRINGKPGLCIGVNRSNDSNPLEVSSHVQKTIEEIRRNLPSSVKVTLITDQAEFVRLSIKNVERSIVEAVFFVLLIVFLFLRNVGATLIPLVTIPISLLGSFLFLKIFGFSINIITLLAMVLAIGLVVDDAIVVLENIQRHREKGLSLWEAARVGAKEISFAIIAMTLTLTSVYAPLAFVGGIVGDLFVEFAVALSGSVIISGIVALTLSPLMCTKALPAHEASLWPIIDKFLESMTLKYRRVLSISCQHPKVAGGIFLGTFGILVFLIKSLPHETAPKEDRSLVGVWLPPIAGKDISMLDKKISLVEEAVGHLPEAEHQLVFIGDWGGSFCLPLKPQSYRKKSAQHIVNELRPLVAGLPSLDAFVWNYDSGLPGLDEDWGSDYLSLIISTTDTYSKLFESLEKVRQSLDKESSFENIKHDLKLDTPSYRIDFDPNALSALAITPAQIAQTVSIFFSGDQTISFSKDGILYLLTVMGQKLPWSLSELYITNKFGHSISLGALATLIPTSSPDKLHHHNEMRSAVLTTSLKKGTSLKAGIQTLWDITQKELPPSYKKEWTGAAKALETSGSTMLVLFLLAVIFIYAILSVQFENFIDPLIILGTVPLGCLGGLFFVWAFGGSLNIYTQIGLITLIGLITKHGILIVEFVNQLKKDCSLLEATIDAATLRLRPILMTTGAMIFGAIPLMFATGAGHETQQAIGLTLVGGLSFGTFFTLFLLPTLCLWVKQRWAGKS